MKQDEMRRVGGWILRVMKSPDDAATVTKVREEVREFARAFGVPGIA